MKANGLKLATYTTTALNLDELVIQIEAYSPVLMSMTNMSNGGETAHAVVLRGFSHYDLSWSIWNPWYPDYEKFNWNEDYITRGGTVYHCNGHTIYNCRK